MACIPCVYWLANKPPGVYIASNTFGSSWIPAACIDLSVWFPLNISHPVLLHHSCICAIVAVQNKWLKMKNHHVKNERAPVPVFVDIHEPSLSHWGYTCVIHLASIERLLIYICMCEKKLKSLRGYGSSALQRIRPLLQKRTRYRSSNWKDAYFFTAFVFFVSMNYRSLHRHFQYRCGCSNYCFFFWRNLHLQNRAGYGSRWTCCLKGPNVTSWSSKVRSSGVSCLARQGLQHMLCWVG